MASQFIHIFNIFQTLNRPLVLPLAVGNGITEAGVRPSMGRVVVGICAVQRPAMSPISPRPSLIMY